MSERNGLPVEASQGEFSRTFEYQLNRELQRQDERLPSTTSFDDEERLLLPSGQTPGITVESVLEQGLQVPSRTHMVSSGFPYPEQLTSYAVTEEDWARFTSIITSAAKMTSDQWTTTIGKGLGTLAIGGLMVGFMSAFPAYVVAKKIKRGTEADNLRKALREDGAELQSAINEWNETFFRPRGLLVRVDLPGEASEILTGMMDIAGGLSTRTGSTTASSSMRGGSVSGSSVRGSLESSRGGSFSGKGGSSKTGLIPIVGAHKISTSNIMLPGAAETYEVTQQKREKASRRGRVVILPLDEIESAQAPSAASLE